jgi:predicted glycosyltransferase
MKQFILIFVVGLVANLVARLIYNVITSGVLIISGSDVVQGIIMSSILAVVLPKVAMKSNG